MSQEGVESCSRGRLEGSRDTPLQLATSEMAMHATDAVDIHDIQEALRSVLETAKRAIQLNNKSLEQIVHLYSSFRVHDPDDFTFARQLHHLYSTYFNTSREGLSKFTSDGTIRALARKLNHIHTAKRLWPESSWLSTVHTPEPSWLSEDEMTNLLGLDPAAYKSILRRLGYAPLFAPSQDALNKIWNALYPASSCIEDDVECALRTSDAERYAVVSYVQYAGGKKPPATWTSEVDSVLTTLASLRIISEKAVWFDKLASRQYSDSQKWWGAAATMQFLFNPVIVVLPRMSEQQEYVQTVGETTWGLQEADEIFQSFVEHAKLCSDCRSSLPLQWALQQDWVLPVAALRTWPRVEHALGANGLGLFTSETTYVALTALLTCAFAMLAVLIKNDRDLHDVLNCADLLPSCFSTAENDSITLAWVQVTCSGWQHGHSSPQDSCITPLKEIASCAMELYHLFCKLQTPNHLALQATGPEDSDNRISLQTRKRRLRLGFIALPSCTGLVYPIISGEELVRQEIDIPTLARYNSSDMFRIRPFYKMAISPDAFAYLQSYWASCSIDRNLKVTVRAEEQSISNEQYLVARHQALTTLVYTRAAQAPCYAWDDKLVAAILLSSPEVFLDAFLIWENEKKGGQMMADLTRALCVAGVLAEGEDVEWEPNTLIVAVAMQRSQTVHRLIPKPISSATQDWPVHVIPLAQKHFAGFLVGHVPLKAVDALRFRTSAGTALPKLNDWVHRRLGETSALDWNTVVIRQPWKQSGGSLAQKAGRCWHCQMLVRGGYNTPGSSQAPETLVFPYRTTRTTSFTVENDVLWGLGSFDPLNLGSLVNPDSYFGLHPDCTAVLLQRSDSPGNNWRVHSLAHFAILGSTAVHACSSCYALIVEERNRSTLSMLALWTILPDADLRQWSQEVQFSLVQLSPSHLREGITEACVTTP